MDPMEPWKKTSSMEAEGILASSLVELVLLLQLLSGMALMVGWLLLSVLKVMVPLLLKMLLLVVLKVQLELLLPVPILLTALVVLLVVGGGGGGNDDVLGIEASLACCGRTNS
jgi:hypothetical protein